MIVIIYKPVENIKFKGNDSSHSFVFDQPPPHWRAKEDTPINVTGITSKQFINSILSYRMDSTEYTTDKQILEFYNTLWMGDGHRRATREHPIIVKRQRCAIIDKDFFKKKILGTLTITVGGHLFHHDFFNDDILLLFPCCAAWDVCPGDTNFTNGALYKLGETIRFVENSTHSNRTWRRIYIHCKIKLRHKKFDKENF